MEHRRQLFWYDVAGDEIDRGSVRRERRFGQRLRPNWRTGSICMLITCPVEPVASIAPSLLSNMHPKSIFDGYFKLNSTSEPTIKYGIILRVGNHFYVLWCQEVPLYHLLFVRENGRFFMTNYECKKMNFKSLKNRGVLL